MEIFAYSAYPQSSVLSWVMPSKISGPNPWNLWILPSIAEWLCRCDKLRILTWGYYHGSSRWVLKAITIILARGKQRLSTDEEEAMWPQRQRLEWCGHQPRNEQLREADHRQPRNAGGVEERILPWALQQEPALPTLIFSSIRLKTSSLQSCKRISLCIKSLTSWQFVTVAIGN